MSDADIRRAIRAAQTGLATNIVLVLVKLLAGFFGHAYALVADAAESSTDIFSSLIVWGGLNAAATPPDEDHPFGHGKAEAIAGAAVSLILILAAVGIAAAAVKEIITPHEVPHTFTLAVAGGVIIVKEILFRRIIKIGQETNSGAVQAEAWHHRSDAISSAAAFIGIAIAILGKWAAADDWAALVAAGVMAFNGVRMLRPAIHDLMDRMPDGDVVQQIAAAARSVEGVLAIEKLKVRKLGMRYYVDIHVQADPNLTLHFSHILSGKVKSAIRQAVPAVLDASIHMEPFDP